MDQTKIVNDAMSQKHILRNILTNLESLEDMTNIGMINKCIYLEASKIGVRKYLDLETPYYNIYFKINKETSDIKIYCKSSKLITSTIDEEIQRLRGLKMENLEKSTNITIWFTGCSCNVNCFNEDIITNECAKFIDSLFDIFINAHILRIHLSTTSNIKYFQLLILQKLTSKNIKIIKGITIESIINYIQEKNIYDTNIFYQLPNLKHLWINLVGDKISLLRTNEFNEQLSTFFSFLSPKNCQVTLSDFYKNNGNDVLIKLINLCEKNKLKVNIDGFPNTCLKCLIRGSYKNIFFNRNNIIGIKIILISEKQCQILDEIFSNLSNIESLHIYIKRSFINDIIKYGKSMQTRRIKIRSILNFKILKRMEKLRNLKVSFEFVERAFSGVKAQNTVYELMAYICESLISLMPSTITKIFFDDVPDFNNDVIDSITNNIPLLESLFLKYVNEIDYEGFKNFKNLKYIYMWREIKVDIPKWVHIVIIGSYNSSFARSIKTNSNDTLPVSLLNESDDYYYSFMKNKFKSSFRYISRYGIKYNVFFNILYDWKIYLWMLNEIEALY
uniref:F-box domain-containing protein n=1 Tax=Parastrongyloides trichosuri TaxID=131310 RepID=A0A0N4Z7D5_PARTI